MTADKVDAVVLSPEDPVGHRSIGLVDALEGAGIATVSITMVPYISIMTGMGVDQSGELRTSGRGLEFGGFSEES